MITSRQKKGIILGIIWSFMALLPFFTDFMSNIRKLIGIPAALGLNLELALKHGDAFVYSIVLGAGMGFFLASLMDFLFSNVKIIGILPSRKKKLFRRRL